MCSNSLATSAPWLSRQSQVCPLVISKVKIPLLRSGVSWGEIHDKERARGESGGGQEWRQLRNRILTTTEPDKYQQASQSGDHLEALRATEGVGGLEDETDDVLLKSFRNVGKTRSLTQRHFLLLISKILSSSCLC